MRLRHNSNNSMQSNKDNAELKDVSIILQSPEWEWTFIADIQASTIKRTRNSNYFTNCYQETTMAKRMLSLRETMMETPTWMTTTTKNQVTAWWVRKQTTVVTNAMAVIMIFAVAAAIIAGVISKSLYHPEQQLQPQQEQPMQPPFIPPNMATTTAYFTFTPRPTAAPAPRPAAPVTWFETFRSILVNYKCFQWLRFWINPTLLNIKPCNEWWGIHFCTPIRRYEA